MDLDQIIRRKRTYRNVVVSSKFYLIRGVVYRGNNAPPEIKTDKRPVKKKSRQNLPDDNLYC